MTRTWKYTNVTKTTSDVLDSKQHIWRGTTERIGRQRWVAWRPTPRWRDDKAGLYRFAQRMTENNAPNRADLTSGTLDDGTHTFAARDKAAEFIINNS